MCTFGEASCFFVRMLSENSSVILFEVVLLRFDGSCSHQFLSVARPFVRLASAYPDTVRFPLSPSDSGKPFSLSGWLLPRFQFKIVIT